MKKIISLCLAGTLIASTITPIPVEAKVKVTSELTMSLRPNQKKKKITVSGTKRKKRFRSTNKTVATVNKKGVVTAKRPGKTSIRVKVGKKTYKCKITVNYAMNRDKMKVAKGDGKQLKIYKVKNVRWSSSDKKVATVNDEGIVIGRKKGKATITGRFGLFSLRSLECKVTVTDTKETQKDSADKKDSANKNSNSSSNTGTDEDSTTAVADSTSTNTSSTDKTSADSSEAVDDNTSNSAEASTTANITKQGSVDYTGANQEQQQLLLMRYPQHLPQKKMLRKLLQPVPLKVLQQQLQQLQKAKQMMMK